MSEQSSNISTLAVTFVASFSLVNIDDDDDDDDDDEDEDDTDTDADDVCFS